jgi:RNA polymerase sigma-70 factor, ECF subfamily
VNLKRKALCSATVVLMLAAPLTAYQAGGAARAPLTATSHSATDERTATRSLSTRSGRTAGRRNTDEPSGALLDLVADYLRPNGDKRTVSTEAPQAWAQFFPWCDGTIRRYAATFRSRGIDVDDCSQEVWADLLKNLPNFKLESSRGQFSSWLYSIVRNKALDVVRRQSRRPEIDLSPGIVAQRCADYTEPAQILVSQEDHQTVRRGLAHLTAQNYQVLNLRYLQGQSVPQVAQSLGITPQQVWTQEHRAKRKLRELLKSCA